MAIDTLNFYLLLSLSSIVISVGAIYLSVRHQNICFLLGIVLFYYWSLMGGWYIVIDESGHDTELSYQYLFKKLFQIRLDEVYFKALFLYSIFIITIELTLLLLLRNSLLLTNKKDPLVLSHSSVLLTSAIFLFLSFLIFRDDLNVAAGNEVSGYVVSRSSENQLFTLAGLLNRLSSIPAVIGLAVFLGGTSVKYIASYKRTNLILMQYIFLILGIFIYASALGNKNELFISVISGLLFYFINSMHPAYFKTVLVGIVGIISISAIDTLRGVSFVFWFDDLGLDIFENALLLPFRSNEMFGAHFSMYGVLNNDVEPIFGYSFYSLLCSVIPRYFWPDRPLDIYDYYATSVNAIEGQGYTIHHATGWYLNFGLFGVILGAILFSMLWAWLYKNFMLERGEGKLTRLFFTIVPWTIVAGIPLIVRAGPEAYKGLLVDCVISPLIPLYIACQANRRSFQHKADL